MRGDAAGSWGRGLLLRFRVPAGASPARLTCSGPARASPAGHVARAASGAPERGSLAVLVFQVEGAAPMGQLNSGSGRCGGALGPTPRSGCLNPPFGSKCAAGTGPDLDPGEARLRGRGRWDRGGSCPRARESRAPAGR